MTRRRSILIVDDNRFDVLLARKLIERSGLFEHVYDVTDGAEALALFQDCERTRQSYEGFPPAVILLDINMPLMNGFEFLESYAALGAADSRETSIIVMLTSSSYGDDRKRALEFPMVKTYIVKPLTQSHLQQLAEVLQDDG